MCSSLGQNFVKDITLCSGSKINLQRPCCISRSDSYTGVVISSQQSKEQNMTTHGAAPVPAPRESYEPVDAAAGADSAGARVLKIGDPDAKRVLILVGGREGGASAFRSFGRELT